MRCPTICAGCCLGYAAGQRWGPGNWQDQFPPRRQHLQIPRKFLCGYRRRYIDLATAQIIFAIKLQLGLKLILQMNSLSGASIKAGRSRGIPVDCATGDIQAGQGNCAADLESELGAREEAEGGVTPLRLSRR